MARAVYTCTYGETRQVRAVPGGGPVHEEALRHTKALKTFLKL